MNRKYNIDAYRNASDLEYKRRARLSYNNMLLSCYDTAMLFLMDIYYSPSSSYPEIHRVTVPDIVKAISAKDARVTTMFGEYVSMYKTYYAVYNGKIAATETDVKRALNVVNSIIVWYVDNIDFENLVELFEFTLINTPLPNARRKPIPENRHYIAEVIGLYNVNKE